MQSTSCHHVLTAGLCLALAASAAFAQTSQPAASGKTQNASASLKTQTTPVPSANSSLKGAAKAVARQPATPVPVAGRKSVTEAPAGTVPANIPDALAKGTKVDPSLSSPAGAVTGTVNQDAVPDLGDEFEYVPMPGGDGVKKRIEGSYTHTTLRRTETPAPPIVTLNIEKEPPAEPEPREKPKVWVVPTSANVSPTTGNLLTDGFLQYDRGPERIGHRISNDIWNFKDKKVRISVDENRGIRFQVIAELQGKQRRLVLKADNLIGPRPLPADKCVTVSRVWYTRGQHGREPDSWWDSPHTLVPIYKPLLVPSEDNTVPGQTNQAFVVTIYIPKLVLSGVYRTTLHVTDLDDPTYYDNIQVEVSAQPDGKKMRSVIG